MIKNFIDKLLGKTPRTDAAVATPAPAGAAAAPRKAVARPNANPAAAGKAAEPAPRPVGGVRVEIPKSEHRIDPKLVDERAAKVVSTLAAAGYQAYIVGGAVRDLLVGLRPKDFDVATDATPEQVKALFRRAFIIGRRFRIVHVVFGRGRQERGLSEVIEVSTFRAMVDNAAAEQVAGNEKTSRSDLAGRLSSSSHVVDAEGRVLRDNVWGPQVDDAARRDFTINAMYYDPVREIVVDYHGGLADVRAKLLRMIGDPTARYREDPVRIIRVVRFAAKLGFEIEPATRAPIKEMVALLDNVPPSRTFDEMIKLLQTGHALASIQELRKQGLHRGVFPVLDVALDESQRHDGREKFVQLALADTDRRVGVGKPVAPSFMLACMLWHDVLDGWKKLVGAGEPSFPALQQAIDTVFDARIGDISGRGKLAADMREVWMMQPRFERRTGNSVQTLIEQPRFRAGLDFLRLRGDAGEIDGALANWWEDYSLADDAGKAALLATVVGGQPKPQVRRVRSVATAGDAAGTSSGGRAGPDDVAPPAHRSSPAGLGADGRDDTGPADDIGDSDTFDAGDGHLAADPVRKRRRRRRRSSAGGGEGAGSGVGGGEGAVAADPMPAVDRTDEPS